MAQKAPEEPFLNKKLIKDIKFGLAGFVVMILILMHYAWIMRQLILRPNLTMLKIGSFFVVLLITASSLVYVLTTFVYRSVYAEEVALEEKEKAEREAKKAQ